MRLTQDVKQFVHVQGALRLLLAMVLYGMGTGILAPMNAIYMHDHIGLSKGQVTVVYSVSLLLNTVVTMSVGLVSDRMKRKKGLPIAASVLCMAGLLLYMQARDFAGTLVAVSVALAPSGLIMGQLFAMARNRFAIHAADIQEMALVWLRAGFSVGFFGGLLMGANLFLLFGFHGVLVGNLAGYAGLFVMLLLYSEVTKAEAGTAASPAIARGEPFSIWMLAALLLLFCADAIRGLYLPLVVNGLFGKPQVASYLWSAQAVFELLLMTVTGYWAVKYGSKPVMITGGIMALAAYIVYACGSPLAMFFIVQPLYSYFVSILYGVAMGVVQRMFIRRTGFGSSLYVALTQAASLIGYILPTIIHGVSPLIFILPMILVAGSLAVMSYQLYQSRRIKQHGDQHLLF
ncbi:MFS transporter [Paenibacillus sp. R14(2021)]|uniref:MFS transporter n=1 Tax=Paenibacillus sp. R14(2021) TaxID=2859228 RepID=UPI001C613B09|nr:MFS transporter [Paenibacillus sp. R14(2021)]